MKEKQHSDINTLTHITIQTNKARTWLWRGRYQQRGQSFLESHSKIGINFPEKIRI